jgi:hypothetical protein
VAPDADDAMLAATKIGIATNHRGVNIGLKSFANVSLDPATYFEETANG